MAAKTYTLFLMLILLPLIAICQERKLSISDPTLIDESYNLYFAGDVFLAGQPMQTNLDSLIEAGVTLVVNLRTGDEMEHLSFNEAKYLKSKKIKYIHIPMGGDDGYKAEAIDKIGKSINKTDGKVLIHCRSAGRATYAWMAWLIRYQDYSIDEAVRMGSKARFSVPFFNLLGYPITIQKK
jgi:protein tyrosine phosphatase (PTP) superfamily phosphohydrolase (DUF442 family)